MDATQYCFRANKCLDISFKWPSRRRIPADFSHDAPFSRGSADTESIFPRGRGREEERVRESALLGSVNPGTFPRINLPRFPPPETTLLPIPADVKRERRTRRCRNSEMSFPCSSRASPSRLFTSRARFIRRLTPVYVYGRAAHGRRRRGRRCNRRASECFFFFLSSSRGSFTRSC